MLRVLFESSEIAVQVLQTDERRAIARGVADWRYVASDYIVHVRQGTLAALSLDVQSLKATGAPIMLPQSVVQASWAKCERRRVLDRGTVLHLRRWDAGIPAASQAFECTFVWVDRQGRETPVPAPARACVYPRLSLDETRIAVDIRDQDQDIHLWDIARETLSRLTLTQGPEISPAWSPDGRRIAFSDVGRGIDWRAADGTGALNI